MAQFSGSTYSAAVDESKRLIALATLGNAQVDMSDYYNKRDSDNKFAAKVDLDTLTTSVNDLKTVHDTHVDDTDIHVTTSDKIKWNKVDNKVDKTSIVTAISASPSDNNLLSEKAIKSELDKKSNNTDLDNFKQGILVTQTSMNKNILLWDVGHYYFNGNDMWQSYEHIPNTEYAPHVYVTSVLPVKYKDTNNVGSWFRQIKVDDHLGKSFIRTIYTTNVKNVVDLENGKILSGDDCSDTGWQRVCTTSVANSSGTVTLPDGLTGTISYRIINGVCYVSVNGLGDGLTGNDVTTITGLPKSDMYVNVAIENAGGRIGTIYTDNESTFHVHKTTTSPGFGSFSYPVA